MMQTKYTSRDSSTLAMPHTFSAHPFALYAFHFAHLSHQRQIFRPHFFSQIPKPPILHSEFTPDMEQDHHAHERQRCDQYRRWSHLQSRTVVGVKLKNIRGPTSGASTPSGASSCCGFACLCLNRERETSSEEVMQQWGGLNISSKTINKLKGRKSGIYP